MVLWQQRVWGSVGVLLLAGVLSALPAGPTGSHRQIHRNCTYPEECLSRNGRVIGVGLEQPCVVLNITYSHGETFLVDCRTQCVCQNGRYACASLCPQEGFAPRCLRPRLVDLPGQCCRQWLCDPEPRPAAEQPARCDVVKSRWSPCSTNCGVGLSRRERPTEPRCDHPFTTPDTRLCATRPCAPPQPRHHHVRKGHECKATWRHHEPTRMHFASCISRKMLRPKYCGACSTPGMCCEPSLSTTVRIAFLCDIDYNNPDFDLNEMDFSMSWNNNPWSNVEVTTELLSDQFGGETTTEQMSSDLWNKFKTNFDNTIRQESNDEESSRIDHSPFYKTQKKRNKKVTRTFSVQWILKCVCRSCNQEPMTENPPVELLHRVHRTSPP